MDLGRLDYFMDPAGLLSDATAHGGLWVEHNLTIVILAIVGISLVPPAVRAARYRWNIGAESTGNGERKDQWIARSAEKD